MKTYYYSELDIMQRKSLLKRPAINFEATLDIVKPILHDIKQDGMNAVMRYAWQFDKFEGTSILLTEEEYTRAENELDESVKKALENAAENIRKFHKEQLPVPFEVETAAGVKCSREYRPIENVGLYVPGGNAVLPSTMLMLGIPAKIAGCKRLVVCSPAKENKVNNALLYAAKIIGIDEFYKIGGAQAIGLMAYGCETTGKVDKIFGPGNQYVTAAKMLVSIDNNGCAIDMPAGPSEVLVIANEYANASFIAADLLSQAEHGPDSQVVFVTNSKIKADEVIEQVEAQLSVLPRKEFAAKALESSFILLVDNMYEAFLFSNDYAPEHLILHLQDAERHKEKINNAGSVFIGEYSPESAGDYASGTNHSLPTYGYAKSFGGVTVESFMKSVTFQKLTKEGLKNIGNTIEILADVESLAAHKNAVSIRLKD
jgi:histidinol dehydrogenase